MTRTTAMAPSTTTRTSWILTAGLLLTVFLASTSVLFLNRNISNNKSNKSNNNGVPIRTTWPFSHTAGPEQHFLEEERELPEHNNNNGTIKKNKNQNNNRKGGLSRSALDSWCPNAQCLVSSHNICHPCQRRYLVLIATGRSASTTLQEMLDSLPGIRMSGENNGMLAQFQAAIDATRSKPHWAGAPSSSAKLRAGESLAWRHHPIPNAAFACVTQQMIQTINPPPRVYMQNYNGEQGKEEDDDGGSGDDDSETILGFKTIRFPSLLDHSSEQLIDNANKNNNTHSNPQQLLRESAKFLKEALPCAKFIVNIRSDVESQAESMHHAFRMRTNLALEQRRQDNAFLLEFAKLLAADDDESRDSNKNKNHKNKINKHSRPQQQQKQQQHQQQQQQQVLVLDSSQWTKNVSLLNHDMVSNFLGFSTACHFDQLFELNTQNRYDNGEIISRPKLPPGCTKLPY